MSSTNCNDSSSQHSKKDETSDNEKTHHQNDEAFTDNEEILEESLDFKDPLRRVKLYHLSDSGQWIDKGTGHVHCESQETSTEKNLVLISETSDDVILNSAVSTDDIYQLQNSTLIVWSDPAMKIDMALSFQHTNGCVMIWNQIRKVQGKRPDGKEIVEKNNQPEDDEELGDMGDDLDDDLVNIGLNGSSLSIASTSSTIPKIELPEPSVKNVPSILSTILEHRFKIARYIKPDYISKLFDVFNECEDIDSVEDCRILFKIFTNLISLDDSDIHDILLSPNNIMKLIGVLEYDPDLPTKKANHRNYLQNVVVFKEVIPFNNPTILEKIHQTFRIQYIKETILASIIDDQTFGALSTIIARNNIAIITAIRDDQEFLKKVFSTLLSNDISVEKQKDLSKFLSEFFNLMKHQHINTRLEMYKKFITDYPLLDVAEKCLQSPIVSIRHIYSEILTSLAQTVHISFLGEIKQRQMRNDFEFLRVVIKTIVCEPELGIQDNLTEVIKLLMDPETLLSNSDQFIDQFYKHHIELVASPILSPETTINTFTKVSVRVSCIIHSLELLSFAVTNHKHRSKNFLISHDVISKAIHLLDVYKEKDLVLSVIRFFKTIIGKNDLLLHNYILTHNLFDPIMEIWRKNATCYNLINSAIIDLFDMMTRLSNTTRLKQHCVERFRSDFEKVTYIETFNQLISQQEQKEKDENTEESQHDIEDDDAYFNDSYEAQEESQQNTSLIAQESSPERGMTTSEDEDELFFSLANHKNSHNQEDDESDDVYSESSAVTHIPKTHENEPLSPHKHLQISLKANTTSPTKGEVEPTAKKVKL
ncbi:hypothetical protein C9374_006381 [Naegleria lovaniensis]|uniref:Serine/threonine-protein phosphatase 4 regulatory subunit 3-like central domain-containing protein n=1 Tax=Naegleria lovaniensis TaxID=51637 RepID=A0AA88KHQ8_NAELO|nr:uncharacterized protein C9374_006381 [Naegleria lovaniensis]KAG2381392.1 hypothetical protein C9374_006381 [Naegleria lovaniensis]